VHSAQVFECERYYSIIERPLRTLPKKM
jgi:hypothetical protein